MKAVIPFRLCARRAVLVALLSAAGSSVFLAAPLFSRDAAAQTIRIRVEAENYTWSFNEGGEPICISTCDKTNSGGKAVDGVDFPGDWIEMDVSVPEPMLYRNSLCSAGDVGLRRKFVIQYMPLGGHGERPAPDTLTTRPGTGAG
jgi:hypothetical protein